MDLRILAIDPGYDRCGVAILERSSEGGERLLHSECVTTNTEHPFEQRLLNVVESIRSSIDTYKPTVCALEGLFFTTNRKTAMHVAEVRGALIALVTERGLALREFGPGQVKVAITGDGRASKGQVTMMVSKLIPLRKGITYDDEYDAIAIALTASALHARYRHD